MTLEKKEKTKTERDWTKTNLLHAGAGLVALKVAAVSAFGPLGIALVGANYVSVSTTGKSLLPNPFARKNKTNILDEDVIFDNAAKDGKEQSEKQTDKSLLKIIKAVENTEQKHMRRKATGYSMLTTTLTYSTPLSMALIFSTILTGGLPVLAHLGLRNVFVQLGVLYGGMTGLAALESATRHHSTKTWKSYAAEIEHILRSKSYAHILQLDMAEQEEYGMNQLIELTSEDQAKIRLFLENVPNQTIDRVTSFIIGGSILFLAVPISLLLTLLIMPVPYFLMKRYRDRQSEEYGALGQAENNVSSQLHNTLAGLAVIKSFNTETWEQQRLTESSEEFAEKFVAANTTTSEQIEVCIFSYQVGMITPTFASGILLLLGKLSITRFMVQGFMIGKLMAVSAGIRRDYDLYRNADTSARNLEKFLEKKPKILNGNKELPVEGVQGRIKFDNVSFGYSDDKPVLKNINLRIEPGQHVAFVGPTGSGKSTLIKLLLRFYDTQEGCLLLDGFDLRKLDIHSLRQTIGLVSQEVYLFPGSIYENICYGSPDTSYEEVVEAARMAEALEFIDKLPEGFDSMVIERGQNFSGGQRQRLSIARAILKRPPILIMDEATSAVDNETEAFIQRSIAHFSHGLTTLIIAHRLSTIRHADCIYVLKAGRITEFGSHDKLLEHNDYYAHLWHLQTGENLPN